MFYFAEDVFFYHGPVFLKVRSAVHGINHYPLDSAIGFPMYMYNVSITDQIWSQVNFDLT